MGQGGVTSVGVEFVGLVAPRLALSQSTNDPRAKDTNIEKTSRHRGVNEAPLRIEAERENMIGDRVSANSMKIIAWTDASTVMKRVTKGRTA